MIYNWARPRLCIVFYLKASLLKKLDLWCSLGGICTTATEIDHVARILFSATYLVVQAKCNWRLHNNYYIRL
jgi:hypothetical protein